MRMGTAAVLAGLLCAPATAQACGGFFCNNNQPVDQAGEHILFAVEGDTITAHIQIKYQGPSEDFSWVLPVPSVPDFGIGTEQLFTTLRPATDPSLRVEWKANPDCDVACSECWDTAAGTSTDDTGDSSSTGDTGGGGVAILAEGSVGPFDYKVVSATDGSELFDWLNDNGYDQPEAAEDLVIHYVNQEYVFVAVKLAKDKDAGEMQPLVITYQAPDLACIPLKLTSIAATDDMPVWSWVLARARAVPMNYFHVLLNPRKLDWLKCGMPEGELQACGWGAYQPWQQCDQAYIDLVTEAANEANGHAFVTEFAGASAAMEKLIYTDGQYDTQKLKTITSPVDFLQQLVWDGWPRDGLMQGIIKTWIPKPPADQLPSDCQTDQQFYSWNLQQCLEHMPEGWDFDPVGFADDLQERILEPLKDAQALFAKYPYMTRLFSTVSPDEMTKDPLFSFNKDLPDVSNVHQVTAEPTCDAEGVGNGVVVTYPGGDTVTVAGTYQECSGFVPEPGITVVDDEGPDAAQIQVLGEEGAPLTVGSDEVDEKEAEIDGRAPTPGAGDVEQAADANDAPWQSGTFGSTGSNGGGSGGSGSGDSSGCSAGLGGSGGIALLLLLAGLALSARLREE